MSRPFLKFAISFIFYDANQFFPYFRNLSGMDSFSPGGRFSQSHESLTNGTVDEIIRESSDDIDHRSIIDQWPPVGQRKQGWFLSFFDKKKDRKFLEFELQTAHQNVQKCVGVILNFFSYSDKLINMYSSAVLKRAL